MKRQHRPIIVAVGLFGAALIYCDGAITPAISVLSALEGLDIVTSTFHPYILPAAVAILIFIAMREIWRWTLPAAAAVASGFFVVDSAFLAANLTKVTEGGYVPLLLAAVVYGVMLVWHLGAQAVSAQLQDSVMPIASFMARMAEGMIPRVPGTAVFLTRTARDVPPVMVWHLKHNRALHERLFVLTVVIESVPWIGDASSLNFKEIAPRFWRATARYGFMERPDTSRLPVLADAASICQT